MYKIQSLEGISHTGGAGSKRKTNTARLEALQSQLRSSALFGLSPNCLAQSQRLGQASLEPWEPELPLVTDPRSLLETGLQPFSAFAASLPGLHLV